MGWNWGKLNSGEESLSGKTKEQLEDIVKAAEEETGKRMFPYLNGVHGNNHRCNNAEEGEHNKKDNQTAAERVGRTAATFLRRMMGRGGNNRGGGGGRGA